MPDNVRACRPAAVLDHVAVGTRTLADGFELFGGLLGGAWAYGGDSPGFWWGQLRFASGPKVELLTPTGGPDAAFLERFLASRGSGVHHLNFIVPAIEETLGKVRALGIEPVGVNLQNPGWKEAFVRPADAFGTVVQVAEQAAPPPASAEPAGLGEPGAPSSLNWLEQRVADIGGAVRLFHEALDGEIVSRETAAGRAVVEVAWRNHARLRLVESAPDGRAGSPPAEGIAYLHFSPVTGEFSAALRAKAADLSGSLGVSLRLGG